MVSRETPSPAAWFKVAITLAALLTGAFTAWAGVVWSASQDLRTVTSLTTSDVRALAITVKQLNRDLQQMKLGMARHELSSWHVDAGMRLMALRTQVDQLQREMASGKPSANGDLGGYIPEIQHQR